MPTIPSPHQFIAQQGPTGTLSREKATLHNCNIKGRYSNFNPPRPSWESAAELRTACFSLARPPKSDHNRNLRSHAPILDHFPHPQRRNTSAKRKRVSLPLGFMVAVRTSMPPQLLTGYTWRDFTAGWDSDADCIRVESLGNRIVASPSAPGSVCRKVEGGC